MRERRGAARRVAVFGAGLVVAAAVATFVVSDRSPSEDRLAGGMPIAHGVRSGPGSDLFHGLTVPGGTGGAGRDLSLHLELHQQPGDGDVPPQSVVTIEAHQWPRGTYGSGGEVPVGRMPSGPVGEVPSGWPSLPATGEPFWSMRNLAGDPEPFEVPRGARLLMHSAVLEEGVSWSLFEVTGSVTDVARRFQDQDDGDACPIRTLDEDGTVTTSTCWTGSGGHSLWAVERPGEPAWLLLQANPLT